jgi:hypothetical protein
VPCGTAASGWVADRWAIVPVAAGTCAWFESGRALTSLGRLAGSRSVVPAVVGDVLVEFEELEDAPHGPGTVRDREHPAVASRVLGGVDHQTDATRVYKRQLVEIQQHALVPLAQHSEALRDRINRGDVEFAAKPHTRPLGLVRHENFQGWLLSVQRTLISPG